MGRLRTARRIAVLVPVTALGVALQWTALKLDLPVARRLPMLYHRIVLAVLGVRRFVSGAAPQGEPALILANHVSWVDIPVIGSLVPLSFIAKSEIAGWPIFGTLARMQRSVFIDRARRRATTEVNGAVALRLAKGEAIVLFAEGTTGDGTRVLPFRSALVGAVRDALADPAAPRIVLQPLSIAYTARDGLPLGRAGRPTIAWYGDMELGPHLMGILRGGPFDVSLVWGEPIVFEPTTDRKQATVAAERAVRREVLAAIRGRRSCGPGAFAPVVPAPL